jgi:hypothetical protein
MSVGKWPLAMNDFLFMFYPPGKPGNKLKIC